MVGGGGGVPLFVLVDSPAVELHRERLAAVVRVVVREFQADDVLAVCGH